MEVTIREALPQDAGKISEIYAASWKHAYRGLIPQAYLDNLRNDYWSAAFLEWIEGEKISVSLVCVENRPVGAVAYGKSRWNEEEAMGEIISIYIHPDWVSKGYGTKLIRHALARLKKQGYRQCCLWAIQDNLPARRFYEKNGFHCDQREHKMEIMGQTITDVHFVASLENMDL